MNHVLRLSAVLLFVMTGWSQQYGPGNAVFIQGRFVKPTQPNDGDCQKWVAATKSYEPLPCAAAAGNVQGGGSLNTVGAIPYVSAASTLGEDDYLTWAHGRPLLRAFQAKLATIMVGNVATRANIAWVGDSWTQGIMQRVQTDFSGLFGNPGAGWVSYAPTNYPAAGYGIVTPTGSWTTQDPGNCADGFSRTSSTNTDKIEFVGPIINGKIHYLKQTGGGLLDWSIDGGSTTTVDTSGAAAHGTIDIGTLSNASHTVKVQVNGSGSPVTVCGINARMNANGAIFHQLGHPGATSLSFSGLDQTILQAGLTDLLPDLLVIMLGVNDKGSEVVPATQASRLTTIINTARAANPLVEILLLPPIDTGTTHTYTITDYIKAQDALSRTLGTAFLQLMKHTGSYSDANTRGLMTNTTHTNANGDMLIASIVGQWLRDGVTPQPVSQAATHPANGTASFDAYWGFNSGRRWSVGSKNAGVGYGVGRSATTASNNFFGGYLVGASCTTCSNNVMINTNDLGALFTTAGQNVRIGQGVSVANFNNGTLLGYQACGSVNNVNAEDIVCVGVNAGQNATNPYRITVIGQGAGKTGTTFQRATFVGSEADTSAATCTYCGAYGAGAVVDGSNKYQIGRTATDSVQLGGYARMNGATKHFSTIGTLPGVSACGTDATIAGTDQAGTITVGTGGTAQSCTVTFVGTYTNEPSCDASHEGAILFVRKITTTATLVIDAATPFTASGKIKYHCGSWE